MPANSDDGGSKKGVCSVQEGGRHSRDAVPENPLDQCDSEAWRSYVLAKWTEVLWHKEALDSLQERTKIFRLTLIVSRFLYRFCLNPLFQSLLAQVLEKMVQCSGIFATKQMLSMSKQAYHRH